MLDKKSKDKIISKFKTHDSDTGSSEVQIAILSHEIKELSDHLKIHKKDNSSRRGLLRKVNQRRKLLRYLKRHDATSYDKIMVQLKIKSKIRRQELAESLVTAMEETLATNVKSAASSGKKEKVKVKDKG